MAQVGGLRAWEDESSDSSDDSDEAAIDARLRQLEHLNERTQALHQMLDAVLPQVQGIHTRAPTRD